MSHNAWLGVIFFFKMTPICVLVMHRRSEDTLLALVVSYHSLGPLPIKPLDPGHLIYFFHLAPAVQLFRKVSECILTGQARTTYSSWDQSMWLGDYNIHINQSLSGLSRACYWRMRENEGRSGTPSSCSINALLPGIPFAIFVGVALQLGELTSVLRCGMSELRLLQSP